MAEFPKAILTDAGKQMIARAQMGEKLIFTKGKYGEGQLIANDNVEALTDLKSPKLTLPIQEMSNPKDGQTTITLLIDRENLQGGFWGRELGLFAKIDEGGTEKLFCYTNAGTQADYIAKTDSVVSEFIDIDTIVGNVNTLEVVIDKTKVYVTKEKLEDHENDPEAHGDIWKNLPSGVPVGTIIAYAGETVPAGFLECNGATLKRTTFTGLFKAIGTLWGSTTSDDFKLPNTYEAARFLRGRSASVSVGTVQEDSFKSHVHPQGLTTISVAYQEQFETGSFLPNRNISQTLFNDSANYTDNGTAVPLAWNSSGGDETRPKSAVVMYCIKYADEVTNKEQVDLNAIVQDLANRVRYEDYQVRELKENYLMIELPNGYAILMANYTLTNSWSNDTLLNIVFPFAFLSTPIVTLGSTGGTTGSSGNSEGAILSTVTESGFSFFSRWAGVPNDYKTYQYVAMGRIK